MGGRGQVVTDSSYCPCWVSQPGDNHPTHLAHPRAPNHACHRRGEELSLHGRWRVLLSGQVHTESFLQKLEFIQLGFCLTARCQAWVSSKGGIQISTEERAVQGSPLQAWAKSRTNPKSLLWLQGHWHLHTLVPVDTDVTTHCSRFITLISQIGFKNHSASLSPGQQKIFCLTSQLQFMLLPRNICLTQLTKASPSHEMEEHQSRWKNISTNPNHCSSEHVTCQTVLLVIEGIPVLDSLVSKCVPTLFPHSHYSLVLNCLLRKPEIICITLHAEKLEHTNI